MERTCEDMRRQHRGPSQPADSNIGPVTMLEELKYFILKREMKTVNSSKFFMYTHEPLH